MRTKHLIWLVAAAFVAGCGVRFEDSTNQNAAIPSDFTSRTFSEQPHSVRVDLEHHLGSLWLKRNDAQGKPQYIESTIVIVPTGFKPAATVPLYPASASSQIDSSFAAKGAYASLLSVGLSGSQAISFTLVDTLEAVIPEDQIPNDLIATFESGGDGRLALLLAQAQAGDTIVYVRMLILSTITKKNSGSQDANGTANTPVYQVNSSLHSEASDVTIDYMVGIDFRPIATVSNGAAGLTINTTIGNQLRAQTAAAAALARTGSLLMNGKALASTIRTQVLPVPGNNVPKFHSAYPGVANMTWAP